MSDPRPPEPGADAPVAASGVDVPPAEDADIAASDDDTGAPDRGPIAGQTPPSPAVPPIDLSEPELAGPGAAATDEPVSAGEPAPAVLTEPAAAAAGDPEPVPSAAPPMAPTGDEAPPLPLVPPDGDTTPSESRAEHVSASSGGQAWKMVLVVVVFLAVVVVAYLLGKGGGDDKEPIATTTSSTTINTAPVDTAGWATSNDEASGFTIKHPKDWETIPATGDVRLLLRLGSESVLGISARDVDASVAPGVIQQAMADVELLENPREFSLNGLPAAVYIYKKPTSADNPAEGVVVHYFALARTKMYALVFVTSPPEELNRLGRTISAVAESFTSSLEAPPEPSTTSSPPTTAAAATTSTTG